MQQLEFILTNSLVLKRESELFRNEPLKMVITRLSRKDAKEIGWLLDGYPRSSSQAQILEDRNIRPDLYIVLDDLDEV
ncbi:probable adenylate kinase 2, chloroplastic isoform X2 [Aristolochia californica]|uniref:probable adenylate kinase 2, chloroplastic isoform X2 n=1 Tax=Aristolochia californica TaxID=171875 RepID=UPI0035DE82BD